MATRVTPLSLSELYVCGECKFWEQDGDNEWGHCGRFVRDVLALTLTDDFCEEWSHWDAPTTVFFDAPIRPERTLPTEAIKQVTSDIFDRPH